MPSDDRHKPLGSTSLATYARWVAASKIEEAKAFGEQQAALIEWQVTQQTRIQ